jgi:hypothetical protein
MRALMLLCLAAPLALTACGSTHERTVVVPSGSTVVVPEQHTETSTTVTKTCPAGYSSC